MHYICNFNGSGPCNFPMEMAVYTSGMDYQEMMEFWFLVWTKEVLLQMSNNNTMERKLMWVNNKTNEMDKVFTLLGECSASLHYVRFPDVKEKTTQDLSILDALLISAKMYSEYVLPVQLF